MSKPYFRERAGWAEQHKSGSFTARDRQDGMLATYRVRVTDARRPSALRAVRNILQLMWDEQWAKCGEPASAITQSEFEAGIERMAHAAGMTARIVNGKVKCDWKKEVDK